MMRVTYDVAIAGLGAMGAAAAHELTRRRLRVLGFDRHVPPHSLGSSHGETRIIREAYFEHPAYVPLVRRAFERWRALELECGAPLLRETGGLMIGRADSLLVRGAERSARMHGLPHELLTASEVRARFPALRPDDDMVAVCEPRAGILFPEACIRAFLASARGGGADLRGGEAVRQWVAGGEGVSVATGRGEYRARWLILSAGAWLNSLLPESELPLNIERQVLHWFEPGSMADAFAPERCPIHLWQLEDDRFFYGFPDLGTGVKAGFHHAGETTTADGVRRDIAPAEIDAVRAVLRRHLPGADGPLRKSLVCLYTNTPDGHFLIDAHPQHRNVLIASACSGHGFKFAPAIGEILADLVQGKTPPSDIGLFCRR
jgi:sarcosine oxidase